MTTPHAVEFAAEDLNMLSDIEGTLVVFANPDKSLSDAAEKIDVMCGGMLSRALSGDGYTPAAGKTKVFNYPPGIAASTVILASLGENPDEGAARKTGAKIAAGLAGGAVTICAGGIEGEAEAAALVLAIVLRLYDFTPYKTGKPGERVDAITVTATDPARLAARSGPMAALAEGTFFTRDLVNEPANTLTTDEFAARLGAMGELGLDVEILGEPELRDLGARALLGVGQGSDNESKLVVMKWMGGGDEAPLALVGKGVIFDTGGISLKPAGGMEDMTMDMGGAGVVAGVMRTLALRKARANVIGIVGLVENMPDARAQRPGDIVKSMKGDTIEIINTDAEGRLVLADALWYAQETFQPAGIIDLATLTGAIIVALSKSTAGHFANDDAFEAEYAAACKTAGEKSWRMPLDEAYHDQIKSRLADIKNTGGRNGGACTAAAFLEKFIAEGTPWIHIDIAGVTVSTSPTATAPKGATGWGVAALDQLVRGRQTG